MKFLIFFFLLLIGTGCSCTCEYVVYNRDPSTNYQWKETYRSTWDVEDNCKSYQLDESTYTDSDGDKWYSRTEIECTK